MMPLFLASAISDSLPASLRVLLPQGILMLGDAGVRALLVACMVGVGLRLMAPRHVPTQKAAWGLVLGGALLMPVLAPWAGSATWVPEGAAVVVPTHTWAQYIRSRVDALRPSKVTTETVPVASSPIPAASHASKPTASKHVRRSDTGRPVSAMAERFPAPSISYGQPTAGTEAPTVPPAHTSYYLPLSDLAWMIYGAICLALLLRLAYGLGAAIGLWQSAQPISPGTDLADGLHLRCSPRISSPVTVGSAVVLPADFDEWDPEKLRIVLAHERSHVRQGDFYLQAVAGLYAAIFWFSPLGWWLKRKLSDLSETISDRAGLEEAASHASYAQILLEFAAMPRRTQVGVAMAHSGRISQRIERLLNERSFRQAFAGGRGRLWAALALVPAVLFAASALIRVEAAKTLQHPATELGPVVIQSHPEIAPLHAQAPVQAQLAAPATPATLQTTPATPPPADPVVVQAPSSAPPAPSSTAAPPATPSVAPVPPRPADATDEDQEDQDQDQEVTTVNTQCKSNTSAHSHSMTHVNGRRGSSYSFYSDGGDSYALVSGNGKDHINFSGDWYDGRRAEFEKARSMAKGDFLWFTRDGKSYVVDDPQIVARIQAMYKPMEDLGRQQEELGRKQEALGRQQEELGRRQEQASIPTPNVSHEMAELNAALAKLEAKRNGTITMDQLADIQSKIGDLQGKLGDIQGEIGARQGELGRQQGELGEKQGRLGEEQGRLGEEQGRLAHEADSKVKSIMNESLKNGKARPVQ